MRSVWKGSFFLNKTNVFHKSSTLVNKLFKHKVIVAEGTKKKSILVKRYMLGLKIGEFIFNRKMGSIHKPKKSLRNSKKK